MKRSRFLRSRSSTRCTSQKPLESLVILVYRSDSEFRGAEGPDEQIVTDGCRTT